MPEGDTVHRAARAQHAALAGARLTGCQLRVPRFAEVDLSGQTVHEVVAVGKHLIHRVGEVSIHSHLKMEGTWRVFPRLDAGDAGPARYAPWRRAAFQARAVLSTEAVQSVGFELGVLEVIARSDEPTVVGHLGPDLLDPVWADGHLARAVERLTARPDIPVFVAVLDQRNLAGIGNVYANELCFLRGVLPTRPIGDTDAAALVELARRLLVANLDRTTRSTTGELRRGRTTWVYGRTGEACRRCGTRLEGSRLGPELGAGVPSKDRVVTWCPNCQR